MSTKLKLYLGRKIIESLKKSKEYSPFVLQPFIQIDNEASQRSVELSILLKDLEKSLGTSAINDVMKIQPDDIIKNIGLKSRKLSFEIEKNIFIKDVLENCVNPDINLKPKTIVVEFSSPNIAKPFHIGHLRSTIIGNFISNLNIFLKNNVTKINYLGDWGTQFGYIKVGVDKLKLTSDDIKNDPVKMLYKAYVHANSLAENDSKIAEKAKEEFNKLEKGLVDNQYWKDFMEYTKKDLDLTYKRLGVTFDYYFYESMYNSNSVKKILETLIKKNIISKDQEGKYVALLNDHKVSLLKSDGSTLYLTRDIAGAIDRFEKFKFDQMIYVVDGSQTNHFNSLKAILRKMDLPWADRIRHVTFGRIRGMSTRKGNAVFLKDILDECRELMIKKQIESPTTKASISNTEISDILGVSCVIVNDLKQRRQKDYEFSWEKVLQVQGDTGVKLQYTHCRLISLEKNSNVMLTKDIIPEILIEPEALQVVKDMARFQEILFRANEQLESAILVNYLFHLCNSISKALKTLNVKRSEPDVASQRLLLFCKSREVLQNGMEILGLKPLNEM